MRRAKTVLKTTHAARKYRVRRRDFGRCIEVRRRGIAGRRKRGSWWGIRERRIMAESAEMRGRRCREKLVNGKSSSEGPRRRGRETRR